MNIMEGMSTAFSPLEREALRLLLDGEHPVLNQLRQQLASVMQVTRRFTGVGMFTDFVLDSHASVLPDAPSFTISDVSGTLKGTANGVCFVLFVRDGKIRALEGATFGNEKWPAQVTTFELGYDSGQRNWIQLTQTLEGIKSKNKRGPSSQ